MADIRRIIDLYDLHKSCRRGARELKISRNTVKKYVVCVKEVQGGLANEILPKNREIIQASRVLTEPVRQKIHELLESNSKRPKKQCMIGELLVEGCHRIRYSRVKNEFVAWKHTDSPIELAKIFKLGWYNKLTAFRSWVRSRNNAVKSSRRIDVIPREG